MEHDAAVMGPFAASADRPRRLGEEFYEGDQPLKVSELTVVIPCYNEVGAIRATVEEVAKILPKCGLCAYEIVVVDDGSTDNSAAQINGMDHVRVVRHPINSGYGRALKSGIAAARYDMIAITDADLTYPIDALPKMIEEYAKGFDMVVAARTGDAYRESFIKAPLRAVLRFLVEWTSGKRIPDVNSGLRLFDRRVARRYEGHLCNTFSFTTSLTLAYEMNGRFTQYLPIPYRPRVERTKVRLFRDTLRTLQYITQAAVYYNPFKLFLLLAVGCLCIAGAGFLGSALLDLHSGFLVGVGSVILSVNVLVLGFLGVLLKQIMDK